jgi:hypothetical protein
MKILQVNSRHSQNHYYYFHRQYPRPQNRKAERQGQVQHQGGRCGEGPPHPQIRLAAPIHPHRLLLPKQCHQW